MSGDSLQPVLAAGDYSVTVGLAQAVAQAGRRKKSLAVVSVGLLDGAATSLDGDSRSRLETALLQATRKGDIVARDETGEYTLVFSDMAEPTDTAIVVNRLRSLFPFFASDDKRVSASLGVAVFPDDGVAHADLLAEARQTMNLARSRGANFAMSDRIASGPVGEYICLAEHLGEVIYAGAVDIAFQPKLDLTTGKIIGNEALARLSLDGRQVNPLVFITLAERLGHIGKLGQLMLAQACYQTKQWHDQGIPLSVSVNVSPYQLTGSPNDVARSLMTVIERTGLPAEYVHLELTETPHHIPTSVLREYFLALYEAGIARVAIDDVLTGSSTLDHVIGLPFSEVKLDRGFVLAIEQDNDHMRVAYALAHLTHSLSSINGRKRVITAEGVTNEKRPLVADIGCDFAQGFDICKPLSATDYDRFLRERRDLFN